MLAFSCGVSLKPSLLPTLFCWRGEFFLAESLLGREKHWNWPARHLACPALSASAGPSWDLPQQLPESRRSQNMNYLQYCPDGWAEPFPWSRAQVILFINNLHAWNRQYSKGIYIKTDKKDFQLVSNSGYLFCDYKIPWVRKLRMYRRVWNWYKIAMVSNSYVSQCYGKFLPVTFFHVTWAGHASMPPAPHLSRVY